MTDNQNSDDFSISEEKFSQTQLDILNDIDKDEPQYEDSSTSTEGTDGEASTTKPADKEAGQQDDPNKQPEQQGNSGTGQDKQTPSPEGSKQPGQEEGRFKPDFSGQDVKFKDGSTVSGGIARRVFSRFENAYKELESIKPQYEQLRNEFQAAKAKLEAYETTNQIASQHGLQPQEQANWSRIAAAYKQNPSQAIQFLIKSAKQAGMNVDIGGNSLDTQAISAMIDDKLRPVTETYQQQKAQQEATQRGQEEVSQFVSRFPDAQPHGEEIAEILKRDPNATLESAYWRFRSWMNEKGFDFNRPLREQVSERQAQQSASMAGSNPQTTTTQQPQSKTPMNPYSRNGHSGNPGALAEPRKPQQALANDDWRDIIKAAMQEGG